eukprot:GHUV01041046.1.p1 GENE.GHUV01041046.1~~GHUV01041046.1.p1  ORF type:complete len:231 (+),score=75.95 GHUV01041046.1:320-1012(+)
MRQKYGADLSAEQQLQWLHSSQQASHQHHEQRHGSNLPQNLAPDPQQWHTLLQPADTTAQVTAQQEQEQQQQPLIPMGAYTQREQHLQQQEAAGELEFAYVLNDGQPINMIRLIGLKVIFSKQLPNMPKEYICRLLLDRRHHSCALVDKTGAVLGGITYRVFPQQACAESLEAVDGSVVASASQQPQSTSERARSSMSLPSVAGRGLLRHMPACPYITCQHALQAQQPGQ